MDESADKVTGEHQWSVDESFAALYPEASIPRLRWEQRWTSGGKAIASLKSTLPLMKRKYSRPECNSTPSARSVQICSKWNLLNHCGTNGLVRKGHYSAPSGSDLK